MQYFEVTLANGKNVIAYDAPDSYVESCLTGTGATFKEVSKNRAEYLNCYYGVNGGSGAELLRLHALEAKDEKMINFGKSNELMDVRLIELFKSYAKSLSSNLEKEDSNNLYYKVLLANGTFITAYNAPKSYIESCLTGTGAFFKKSTKEEAEALNNYCNVNTHEGQGSLRIRAIEAQIEIKNGFIMTSVFNNKYLKEMFPDEKDFQEAAIAIEETCPTSEQFDKLVEVYKNYSFEKSLKENLQKTINNFKERNKIIDSINGMTESFLKKIKRKIF